MAVAVAMMIAGCGKGDDVRSTITGAQAKAGAERMVKEAVAQLPQGLKLEAIGPTGLAACDDPTDNGPAGRVFAELRYTISYSDNAVLEQAIPRLASYWESQRYKVIKDFRNDPAFAQLAVENPADGFRVGVTVYHRDGGRLDADLTGSSPCVWENGTPTAR
jgi:hypothetical protein